MASVSTYMQHSSTNVALTTAGCWPLPPHPLVEAPSLQWQQRAVLPLFNTLVASQTLLSAGNEMRRPILNRLRNQEAISADSSRKLQKGPWLEYFASLGDTSLKEIPAELLETTDPETLSKGSTVSLPSTKTSLPRLERELRGHIDARRVGQAIEVFLRARHSQEKEYHQLNLKLVGRLFDLLCTRRRPFDAYRVLTHYRNLSTAPTNAVPKSETNFVRKYERLCSCLRYMNPKIHDAGSILKLARRVYADLKQMDEKCQRTCLPTFLSALGQQRSVPAGIMCLEIYKYMLVNKFDLKGSYFEHLLGFSKFFRQQDLPYADVLARSVAMGRIPPPAVALNVLENLFPYTDAGATHAALQSIIKLQSTALENGLPQYHLDIATMELISAASTKNGAHKNILLIWDLLDLISCKPSEGLYENTAIAFATDPNMYDDAFLVLAEMEEKGMIPSRALIRGLSFQFRPSEKLLGLACQRWTTLRTNGIGATLSGLNALISASAERGNVYRAFALLEEIPRSNLEADADTYSFAFEALGKSLFRKLPLTTNEPKLIASILEKADSLLTVMESQGLSPTHHIVREYVEVLCLAGKVDVATNVVLDLIASPGSVNSKTAYRVSMANVTAGNFDTARRFAADAGDHTNLILKKIAQEEAKASETKTEKSE